MAVQLADRKSVPSGATALMLQPDWSADWLHRESEILLTHMGCQSWGGEFSSLSGRTNRPIFKARLIRQMPDEHVRTPRAIAFTLSATRERHFSSIRAYYTDVFATGKVGRMHPERCIDQRSKAASTCRILSGDLVACSTDRPGSETTYTNNWPHEPLIGNEPTSGAVPLGAVLSFVGLWRE